MADIITAISFAAGAASLCIKALDSLKRFAHGVRSAEDDLREVLTGVRCSYRLLELIRELLIELKESNVREFDIAVTLDGLKETLTLLLAMADEVYRNSSRIRFWRRMIWSLERSRAL
ncbi:hypothetical protein BU26DRAFT_350482 [Trematosphaeria pertusa]|uniref:Fungal N-terminal domain-containing protein n=1 Tax=Trematosphaeria pertusa TaxID=390896 RepID=A0A6A6IB16_9PLEO|nr:uncharacterized protein BU26DRAFT_350482 [Trematosphaeria pertusa]KAF2247606.1 hypothetical protein BU26DRAFT_350482 [Trematosphaeria pertusa]